MKIWEDKEAEQEYFLRLVQADDGSVKLIAVNEKGDKVPGGNILIIDSEGELCRYPSIGKHIIKNLGLKVDRDGKIKIFGVDEE